MLLSLLLLSKLPFAFTAGTKAESCTNDQSYAVSLWAKDHSQQCSGAYLGNGYIATASHCAIKDAKVTIGDFKLTPSCNPQEQAFDVTGWKRVHYHLPKNYKSNLRISKLDFAIAKVNIRGDNHFSTISPITTLVKIGDVLTTASFGTTENDLRSFRCAKTYHKVIGFIYHIGPGTIDTAYNGHPYIAVKALDDNNKVFQGDSGSAFVKDGKLVGTLYSHPYNDNSISFVNNFFASNNLMSKIYSNQDFTGMYNNTAASFTQGFVNLNNDNSCTMDTTGTKLSLSVGKGIVDLNKVDSNKLLEGVKRSFAKVCRFTTNFSGCVKGVPIKGLDPKIKN